MSDYGNQPAFTQGCHGIHEGLTRLEWFAGMALQGLLAMASGANSEPPDDFGEMTVGAAFDLAEAMVAEAEKRRNKT